MEAGQAGSEAQAVRAESDGPPGRREPTELPPRSPGRGPPYWNSRVLRRQAFGDEDDAQVPWVQETA